MSFDLDKYIASKGGAPTTAAAQPKSFDLDSYIASKSSAKPVDLSPLEMPKEKKGKLESFARGAFQGVTFDWSDEITAAFESAFTDKTYDASVKEARDENAQAKSDNPLTYGAGSVAGTVATGLASGGAGLAARAGLTGLKAAAASGAVAGALSGAGSGEGVDQSLQQALIGGGAGAVLGAAASGILGRYMATAESRLAAQAAPRGLAGSGVDVGLAMVHPALLGAKKAVGVANRGATGVAAALTRMAGAQTAPEAAQLSFGAIMPPAAPAFSPGVSAAAQRIIDSLQGAAAVTPGATLGGALGTE